MTSTPVVFMKYRKRRYSPIMLTMVFKLVKCDSLPHASLRFGPLLCGQSCTKGFKIVHKDFRVVIYAIFQSVGRYNSRVVIYDHRSFIRLATCLPNSSVLLRFDVIFRKKCLIFLNVARMFSPFLEFWSKPKKYFEKIFQRSFLHPLSNHRICHYKEFLLATPKVNKTSKLSKNIISKILQWKFFLFDISYVVPAYLPKHNLNSIQCELFLCGS